jgi:hypothetical protein
MYEIATKTNNRTSSHKANFYKRLTGRLTFVWMLSEKSCWKSGNKEMWTIGFEKCKKRKPDNDKGKVFHKLFFYARKYTRGSYPCSTDRMLEYIQHRIKNT